MTTTQRDASTIEWAELSTPTRTDVPTEPHQWKDNAYLGFWDEKAEIYGLFHWSTSPNPSDPAAIYGQLSVTVKGRTIDVIEPLKIGQQGYSSETIRFDLGPEVGIDHPEVKIEFVTRPRFHVADYSQGGIVPALDGSFFNHFHQSAFITGTVTFEGQTHAFDGLGWRDRGWGFRAEALNFTQYFAALVCFEDYDISVFKMGQPDGSVRVDGMVLRENDFDKIVDVSVVRDFNGLTAAFTVTTATGEVIEVERGSVKAHHYVPMGPVRAKGPAFSVVEEFDDFRITGGSAGFGLVEHGILRTLF
ncbi:hypothetical protein [Nocardia sp. NPDC059154]|uniref:DUF7064 domain-containing protein n=1 Tax=Nocardia sp. NPDC059154 TaxID=3346744 RepID=UPI00369CCF00